MCGECPKAFTGIQVSGEVAIARRMSCKAYACPVCGKKQRQLRMEKARVGFDSHSRWQACTFLDADSRNRFVRYLRDHGLLYACIEYQVKTEWENYTVYKMWHHAIPDGLRRTGGKVLSGADAAQQFSSVLDEPGLRSVRFARQFPQKTAKRPDTKWTLVGATRLSLGIIEQILRERNQVSEALPVTKAMPLSYVMPIFRACATRTVDPSLMSPRSLGRDQRFVFDPGDKQRRATVQTLRE